MLIPILNQELGHDVLDERRSLVTRVSERSERQGALVFRGRESILSKMRNAAADLHEDRSSRGYLKIIHGAPGAGKTSLLLHLEEDLNSDVVTTVMVESDRLKKPMELMEKLVSALGGSTEDLISSIRTKSGGRIGVAGTGLAGEREAQQQSVWELVNQHDSFWGLLVENVDIDPDHVLVLLIDETQQQRGQLTDFFQTTVRKLDSGDTGGIKILPIFAGLSDTADTLVDCKVTRMADRPIQLGSLTQQESESVVIDTLHLEETGFPGLFEEKHIQKIARELAVASEGWPRHLHAYIRAFATVCAESMHHKRRSKLNLAKVLDLGHDDRHWYYTNRLNRISNTLENDLKAWAGEHPDDSQVSIDTLPKQAAGRTTIDAEIKEAVRVGVFQPTEYKSPTGKPVYELPIPSMRTHLKHKGLKKETIAALKQTHSEKIALMEKTSPLAY